MSTLKTDAIEAATGTNTNLALTGKGTGKVALGDAALQFPDADGSSSGDVLQTNASGVLSFATPAAGGAWTLIGTQTASTSSTITQTGLTSTYNQYVILLSELVTSAAATLNFRTGAGSIDSGATDYKWVNFRNRAGATGLGVGGSTGDSKIAIDADGGTGTGENISAMTCWFTRPTDGASYPCMRVNSAIYNSNGDSQNQQTAGARVASIAPDRVEFSPSSGTITSGRMTVYGISHA